MSQLAIEKLQLPRPERRRPRSGGYIHGGNWGAGPEKRHYVATQPFVICLVRWREGVQPVLCAQEVFQTLRGQDVLSSKGQNWHLLVNRAFNLAAHLR